MFCKLPLQNYIVKTYYLVIQVYAMIIMFLLCMTPAFSARLSYSDHYKGELRKNIVHIQDHAKNILSYQYPEGSILQLGNVKIWSRLG